MTHADRHDSNEPVTDTWITTKVKADLLASSNVPGTEVKVETVNGVVSLSGTVATQAEHDKAVTTAKGIKGVTRVDASALKVNAAAKR
jgi:hyperosmotically inducible protein